MSADPNGCPFEWTDEYILERMETDELGPFIFCDYVDKDNCYMCDGHLSDATYYWGSFEKVFERYNELQGELMEDEVP